MQGWNLAVKEEGTKVVTEAELEQRLQERGISDLQFLDGESWQRVRSISKPVRKFLADETHVLTVDSPRFIHGAGLQK